jgi:hypothetical protein
MPIRFQLVLAAALPLMVACVSGSGLDAPRPSSSVITRTELVDIDVRNVYEAIDRLRPLWLRVRGGARSFDTPTQVAVFQDDTYLGSLDVLERMGTEGIYSIRYVDGPTAQATLSGIGNRHIQGAIVISMRPDGRDAAA